MPENRPPWITLLVALYESGRFSCLRSTDHSGVHRTDPIHDRVNLNAPTVDVAVEQLRSRELLEQSDGRLKLTQRGFDVAQEHYLRSTNERSPTVDSEYISLGILVLGLFGLIATLSGPLGLTLAALVFLVAAAVGVVVGVTALAFSETTELVGSTQNDPAGGVGTESAQPVVDPLSHEVAEKSVSLTEEHSGYTAKTDDDDEDGQQSGQTKDRNPKLEDTRED